MTDNKTEEELKIINDINVINLNITNACNLRCSFCPIGTKEYENDNAMMSIETVKEFINRVREFNKHRKTRVTVSLSGKGEVTIHKNFREIVLLLAENKDVLRLQIITNGALLYKYKDLVPLFDRIRYNSYTQDNNKNKEQLISFIKTSKNSSIVEIDNTKEWHEISDFTNRVGVLEGNTTKIKYNYCHKLFNKLMIECDGSYLICCDDWKKIKKFDTIYNKSFEEHLMSQILEKYRQDILRGVRVMEPCNTCTYSSNPRAYNRK